MQLPTFTALSFLKRPSLVFALTTSLVSSVCAQTVLVTGSGKIDVYNGTENIGCIDASGAYVLDSCAVFTNGGFHSSDGGCDWQNTSKTLNPFVGAPAFHAFSCYPGGGKSTTGGFYFENNDMCTGDLACTFAVPTLSEPVEGQQVDLQIYFWSDTSSGPPKGWTLVTLHWVPS